MSTATPVITLALYRDAELVDVVERPKFAPRPAALVVEFARRSRLRSMAEIEGPVGPTAVGAVRIAGLRPPIVFAPRHTRSIRGTINATHRLVGAVPGSVVLLCHVNDAPALVGAVGPLAASRLIWHPADRADAALSELVDLLDDLQVRPAVGLPLVYLTTGERDATLSDWRATTGCAVLEAFRAGRRRRRDQVTAGLEHLYGPRPPLPRIAEMARTA